MNSSYGNWPLSKYNSPGIYNPETQWWRPWWANTQGMNQIIVGTQADRFFAPLAPGRLSGDDGYGDAGYGDDGYGDDGYMTMYGGGPLDMIKGYLSNYLSTFVAFYKTPLGVVVGLGLLFLLFKSKIGKKIKRTALRIVKNPFQTGLFSERKRFTGLGRGGYGPPPGARWRNADYRGRHVGSKTKMTKATRAAISANRHNKRRKR
jgi:hypothetical protein